MNFIVFEGSLGSGKTLGAVLFAHYIKQKNKDIQLYSNFGMKNGKDFTSLYDLFHVAYDFSSLIVLDEAHIDLDSRSFNTNHVKFVSQTSFYLRKLRTTFIMTSPLFDSLDSRIRGITNLLCRVHKDDTYFYYDLYDVQKDMYLKTLKIKKEVAFQFDLYDTNAIVSPIGVPETKKDFDVFLNDLKYHTLNYYDNKDKKSAVGGSLQAL